MSSFESIHSPDKDHDALLGVTVVVIVIILIGGLLSPIGIAGICTIISTACTALGTFLGVRARRSR
ncbi:hypothetical protein [Streptomyces sp. NBC_00827]|uniref:hypothetical protein n=1 Tax=Streptomyces sp. NBC_00827 TaxID=2903677 RepID=UPI003870E9B0|nr:hypothetical protein OG569_42230 [Streptomyces sp. NBC_00827]